MKEYVSFSEGPTGRKWTRENPALNGYCNMNCNRDPPDCPGTIKDDEARLPGVVLEDNSDSSMGKSSGLDGSTQKPGGSRSPKDGELEYYKQSAAKYNCKPKGYKFPGQGVKPLYGACGAAAPPACTVP